MRFTPEETESLKKMILFCVKRKHKDSNGHSGFQLNDLQPFLEELEAEGKIQLRPTINSKMYFLPRK